MFVPYFKITFLLFLFIFSMQSTSLADNNIQNMIDSAKDGETILIPSGYYTIKRQININRRKSLTIEGNGLVVIENTTNDRYLIRLDRSDDIEFRNIIFKNKLPSRKHSDHVLIGLTISKNIKIIGCEIDAEYPNPNIFNVGSYSHLKVERSIIRYRNNYSDILPKIVKFYSLTYPTAEFNNNIFELNNKTKKLEDGIDDTYATLIESGNMHNRNYYDYSLCYNIDFDWMNFYKSKSITNKLRNYLSEIENLRSKLSKGEFEKTTTFELRKKHIFKKMMELDRNIEHDISSLRNNEISRLIELDVITSRKSLRNIRFKILNLKKYDADNEMYVLATDIGDIICHISPIAAKSLKGSYPNIFIEGFYQEFKKENKIKYIDLNLTKKGGSNKYECENITINNYNKKAVAAPDTDPKLKKNDSIAHEKGKQDTSPAPTASRDQTDFKLEQIWRGTYTCSQGKTDLDLTITKVRGDMVRAIFNFNHKNRAVGSFSLKGHFNDKANKIVLRPEKWIKRQNGYGMVGMTGKISKDGHNFDGKINFPNCKTFHLVLNNHPSHLKNSSKITSNAIKSEAIRNQTSSKLLAPKQNLIKIISATYGANCGAHNGNVTLHLAKACNGQTKCNYTINYKKIGDPAVGCGKNYIARWICGTSSKIFNVEVNPEAGYRKRITLNCDHSQ